jgi:hypothetical protein
MDSLLFYTRSMVRCLDKRLNLESLKALCLLIIFREIAGIIIETMHK